MIDFEEFGLCWNFMITKYNYSQSSLGTAQLGYCDSDVTVCLLFWNMPIIQDMGVKFPYKRYRYYLQEF